MFVFSLLTALFSLGDIVAPGEGFFGGMISILLYSLFTTAAVVLYSLLAALIYNTLTNFGMKGLRVSLTEVEEESAEAQEAQEEAAPAEQDNENK